MRIHVTIVLIFAHFSCLGQERYTLRLYETGSQVETTVPEVCFKDSIHVLRYLRDLQYRSIKKGYLLSSIDSLSFVGHAVTAQFFRGPRTEKVRIYVSVDDRRMINELLREKKTQLPYSEVAPSDLGVTMRVLLQELLDTGHPFASVKLDSCSIREDLISGKLSIQKGIQIRWSEIRIKGDSLIPEKLISSIIQMKKGDLYSESLFSVISERIRQIPYLQELKPAEVLFTQEGAQLFLYVRSVPVSNVNGMIGLQPNPATERVGITGDVNLKLTNILHRGEQIALSWRSIRAGTQALNSSLSFPFLFGTAFGTEAGFQLYKRDTSFLETRSLLGMTYSLKGGDQLKVFYQRHASSLLSSGSSLNALNGFVNNSYGFSYSQRAVDYLPNPSRGLIIHAETAVGSRTALTADSIQERKTTVRAGLNINWFLPMAKRHVLRLSTSFENYHAPLIYTNELYRFGGLTTLRGFNEEEIFASTKLISSIEYRFLTDRNSHAFLFFDQSIYEKRSDNYLRDLPFGFGAGFSFGTNIGIFSISYAQGKQLNNPILLRNGKVHFGYIAFF